MNYIVLRFERIKDSLKFKENALLCSVFKVKIDKI